MDIINYAEQNMTEADWGEIERREADMRAYECEVLVPQMRDDASHRIALAHGNPSEQLNIGVQYVLDVINMRRAA